MPRGANLKFDETIVQKPNYWGKIFMYNTPSWDTLYPIVDIIRILPKQTIINFKCAKNQHNIKIYGCQYGHLLIGTDLTNKQTYIDNLQRVKFAFVFSDESDPIADNIINYCEKSKTCLICYSNLDKNYHFYDYTLDKLKKTVIKEPENVILKMEELKEKSTLNKLQELFPDFEIIEPVKSVNTLENCIKIIKKENENIEKKKVYSQKIPFDANFNKLKKQENNNKKVSYDDEHLTKPIIHPQQKKLLSQFFKKLTT
jgi:hypothetical protein